MQQEQKFKLVSKFAPTGDQPSAIAKLVDGFNAGLKSQVLLGVTGSGKTFTMANVIAEINRPALILAHNKTLAAQLCNEMREFFPKTASNFLYRITTIINPRPISPAPTRISKRICPSTTR